MFRFDNILEHWAAVYRPMNHPMTAAARPQDKTFFRIDSIAVESEWSRNHTLIQRPCLLYCMAVDAELMRDNPNKILRVYNMYLALRQQSENNAANDADAADCKVWLDEMAIDLVAFVATLQGFVAGRSLPKDVPPSIAGIAASLDDEDRRGLRGLRLEETRWWSTPKHLQGWWLLGIEMEGLDPRQLCILPKKYL